MAKAQLLLDGARQRQRDFDGVLPAVLDQARFEEVRNQRRLPWWVALVAALVGVCGIGYQLLLTTPKQADSSGAQGSGAEVAILVRDEQNPANERLFAQLGLAACLPRTPSTPAGILVVVSSGAGTPEDPYKVTTLPQTAAGPGCPALTFNAIDAVARVVRAEPAQVEISYAPQPPAMPQSSPTSS